MSRKGIASRALALLATKVAVWTRAVKYSALSNNFVIGNLLGPQPVLALGAGLIKVGRNVRIGYYPSPHFFSTYAHLEARAGEALIEIGNGTHINNGFVAIAEKSSIVIGNNCLIGTRCEIFDSDFHALTGLGGETSQAHQSRPVVVEDDVFIGSNVRILKGVTIGHGAVIGNSSVVTRDIPPLCVASGAPAVVRRQLS
jgi:maltose O-acetyltransferase